MTEPSASPTHADHPPRDADATLAGKTCLVTGATSGIGLVTARELARRGARVVMVGRDANRGKQAREHVTQAAGHDDVHLFLADLSLQADIRRLAAQVRDQIDALHVLVNNAGAVFGARRHSGDGIEMSLALNHLGYFLLTNLLLDLLEASAPARIISVSSDFHHADKLNRDDLQLTRGYTGPRAYARSKLANILFTYELARRLAGSAVTANCFHPGFVRTHFGASGGSVFRGLLWFARPLMIRAERAADTGIWLASAREVEGVTGKYFYKRKPRRTSRQSYDEALWQWLWEQSERLTAL